MSTQDSMLSVLFVALAATVLVAPEPARRIGRIVWEYETGG
jgi:hypothetical protein